MAGCLRHYADPVEGRCNQSWERAAAAADVCSDGETGRGASRVTQSCPFRSNEGIRESQADGVAALAHYAPLPVLLY